MTVLLIFTILVFDIEFLNGSINSKAVMVFKVIDCIEFLFSKIKICICFVNIPVANEI